MMTSLEQECQEDDFYLGYLTILDFYIYEIVNYFGQLLPKEMKKYPKLVQLRNLIRSLPKIKEYEESDRKVAEYCPIRYFRNFKEEKKREYEVLGNGQST